MNVREELLKNQDVKYKEFHCKLIPNVDSDKIIGVRIPQLRKIGKALPDNDFAWDMRNCSLKNGFLFLTALFRKLTTGLFAIVFAHH